MRAQRMHRDDALVASGTTRKIGIGAIHTDPRRARLRAVGERLVHSARPGRSANRGRLVVCRRAVTVTVTGDQLRSLPHVKNAARHDGRRGSEPRAAYDTLANRWILTCPTGVGFTGNSTVVLAVWRTSEPTGAWKYWFRGGAPSTSPGTGLGAQPGAADALVRSVVSRCANAAGLSSGEPSAIRAWSYKSSIQALTCPGSSRSRCSRFWIRG